jgi:hypothetical protein
MRKWIISIFSLILSAGLVGAHVTPNEQLVKRGQFIKQSLPQASKFFERQLPTEQTNQIKKQTGWDPTSEELRVYVGRDDQGKLIGSVVFLWLSSEHGPVGLGVAFGSDNHILSATVTDAGTEPVVWIRPLLQDNTIPAAQGLSGAERLDPQKIAPSVTGNMSRYYARVIADGISRAQAIVEILPGS